MFQYELSKPFRICLTYDGMICPRLARFHYMLTPSNSFLLRHRASAGMGLPQGKVELPLLVVIEEVVVVHFEKRTSTALTLDEDGVVLNHADILLSFSMLASKCVRLYAHAIASATRWM